LILNTRRLFCRLLRTFDVATVCDVGSMDGADALRFRRVLPNATVLALEPNPRNFALMAADESLRRADIHVLPVAASDHRAEAPFFVLDADYAAGRDFARRGMSSLHKRSDNWPLAETVRVRTVRLDSLLAAEGCAGENIGLWIDTEGMAFEAISGASDVLDRTQMLHVEVETEPCIGANQRTLPDVERLLIDAGFVLLATDQPRSAMQFNALFVRADGLRRRATEVRWHVARERVRWVATRAVHPLLPRPVRGLLVRRFGTVRGR
jgi:FkbM family methyltransferase